MDEIRFDKDKLWEYAGIDTEGAIKNFDNENDYFNNLMEFIMGVNHYLREYKPAEIIGNECARKEFIDSVNKIKYSVLSLGIAKSVPSLKSLSMGAYIDSTVPLSESLTNFYKEIAAIAESILTAQADPSPALRDDREGAVILAVDDKPEILTAIVSMLYDRFKVMAVTSGNAALKAIEKHSPALFILDIEMPLMNGWELAKRIRSNKQFAAAPIIFLTGEAAFIKNAASIEGGSYDYIQKPVDKATLLNKINGNLYLME